MKECNVIHGDLIPRAKGFMLWFSSHSSSAASCRTDTKRLFLFLILMIGNILHTRC